PLADTATANRWCSHSCAYHAVHSLAPESIPAPVSPTVNPDTTLFRSADDAATTNEDTAVSGNVLANDTDPDNTDGIPGNEDTIQAALGSRLAYSKLWLK